MPNLSKKKRKNIHREGSKAEHLLQKNRAEKFLENQSKISDGWQYDHLNPNQVMLGSDKAIHKKLNTLQKKIFHREIEPEDELEKFEFNQSKSYQETRKLTQSDSEIDSDDDIFRFRKAKKKKESEDEDDVLESSGDDLDYDENKLEEDKSIEDEMEENAIIGTDISSEEELDSGFIDLKEIEKQIESDKKQDRMLNVSDRLYQDSASSDSESEVEETKKSRVNKNVLKDDEVAKGAYSMSWGKNKGSYYGADTSDKKLVDKNKSEQWHSLRDEEAIGIETEKAQLRTFQNRDFVDMEMEELMKNEVNEREEAKQEEMEKEDPSVMDWFQEKDETKDEYPEPDDENEEEEIEKIEKNIDILKEKEQLQLIQKDHPELPAIISTLKETIQELDIVNKNRLKAKEIDFDEAIKDCTLYLDILRLYATTLSFYLQLKAAGKLNKKHGLFKKLVQLKKGVNKMKKVYLESMDIMNEFGDGFDKESYNWMKKEWKEKIEKMKKREKMKEMEENKKKKKLLRIAKEKELKEKRKHSEIRREIIRKGEQKLNYMDLKENGNEDRRFITQKIFKSRGLTRYRTGGIPRVKKRKQFEKRQKQWKRKGYKPVIKDRNPNGRGEWNIPINVTHSKMLD